jgi:hypothetical protein
VGERREEVKVRLDSSVGKEERERPVKVLVVGKKE